MAAGPASCSRSAPGPRSIPVVPAGPGVAYGRTTVRSAGRRARIPRSLRDSALPTRRRYGRRVRGPRPEDAPAPRAQGHAAEPRGGRRSAGALQARGDHHGGDRERAHRGDARRRRRRGDGCAVRRDGPPQGRRPRRDPRAAPHPAARRGDRAARAGGAGARSHPRSRSTSISSSPRSHRPQSRAFYLRKTPRQSSSQRLPRGEPSRRPQGTQGALPRSASGHWASPP